jgi:protein-disulfide isomerase
MQTQASLPEIQEDAQDAINMGARGTPMFVINGKVFNGVIPEETLEKIATDFKK